MRPEQWRRVVGSDVNGPTKEFFPVLPNQTKHKGGFQSESEPSGLLLAYSLDFAAQTSYYVHQAADEDTSLPKGRLRGGYEDTASLPELDRTDFLFFRYRPFVLRTLFSGFSGAQAEYLPDYGITSDDF